MQLTTEPVHKTASIPSLGGWCGGTRRLVLALQQRYQSQVTLRFCISSLHVLATWGPFGKFNLQPFRTRSKILRPGLIPDFGSMLEPMPGPLVGGEDEGFSGSIAGREMPGGSQQLGVC